jgi:hypothetical protein
MKKTRSRKSRDTAPLNGKYTLCMFQSDVLLEADIPIVSQSTCQAAYNTYTASQGIASATVGDQSSLVLLFIHLLCIYQLASVEEGRGECESE